MPGGPGSSRRAAFIALFILLVSSAMVFAALIVAFVARRAMAADWTTAPKPHILWLNTAILLASSFVLDRSRRSLKNGDRSGFNLWWTAATALGFLFLGGQAWAWHRLDAAGVYMASSLGGSFFYLLTGAHALHLLGGLAALVYVDVQAWRLRLGPAKRTVIDVSAIFWHFLDAVWLFAMLMLFAWA